MLSLKNLSYEMNDMPLFTDLSGELASGECLLIAGHNGSGKTTLLRLLAGLKELQTGSISWHNANIVESLPEYQSQVCFVGHKNAVRLNLTAAENLELVLALKGLEVTPQKIRAALTYLDIQHLTDEKASHFSAGQLRRLCLAKLCLMDAKLWILDEPINALDSSAQKLIIQLINQHLQKGGLVILATHQNLSGLMNCRLIQLGKSHAA